MKVLYVEPFAGISGNMLLGALMDAGVPFAYLKQEFDKLRLGKYELINQSVNKCGIEARYFNVITEEGMPQDPVHGHSHEHAHSRGQEQDHAHYAHVHTHEHDHIHIHDQEHGHVHTHVHRNLRDIEALLEASGLNGAVLEKARAVFRAIAAAEAKVHGKTVEEIHFHEVGAIDTIIDIVGNILALQYLGVEKIFTAPVNTGFGFVKCAHGMMPVPAPATAELLQGLPHYRGTVDKEMTTPTGAALLRVLAEPVTEVPDGFRGETIGYGAGTRDVAIPNVLRVNVGSWTPEAAGTGGCGGAAGIAENRGGEAGDMVNGSAPGSDPSGSAAFCETLTVLECNLDNMNPEFLPPVTEALLAAGALDVWQQPIIMKKGRPAILLSALCHREQAAALRETLFTETTTLGIRSRQVTRYALERRWREVETPWGSVRIKEGLLRGKVINGMPEFEDCRRLAQASGQPVKTIEIAAIQAWQR